MYFEIILGALTVLILGTLSHHVIYCIGFLRRVRGHYVTVSYKEAPLTPWLRERLSCVKRKTLVLDMDETLIHSLILFAGCNSSMLSVVPCDFAFDEANGHNCLVYKRPHLDLFLETTCKWFNVVIYTAAEREYANCVLDNLDSEGNMFQRRLYRTDCININGIRSKFVGIIDNDLANIVIVDNSLSVCALNARNSIRIKDFVGDPTDTELISLLIFLDCLRFAHDVRSVLRNSVYALPEPIPDLDILACRKI